MKRRKRAIPHIVAGCEALVSGSKHMGTSPRQYRRSERNQLKFILLTFFSEYRRILLLRGLPS